MTITINHNEFVFFCCNEGNIDLLKHEIKTKYPFLNLSYSTCRYLTYKTTKEITLLEIPVVFATRKGKSLLKTNKERILKEEVAELKQMPIHYYSLDANIALDVTIINWIKKNSFDKIESSHFMNLIQTKEDEFWIGVHDQQQIFYQYPNSDPHIHLPSEAPSRAYLKIAQAVKLFKIPLRENQKWLELGSAPGGSSYYLLENKIKLWGNDPAQMDDICLSHSNFVHLKKPFQHLTLRDIPPTIEWIAVDLNLNPKQVLTELFELCGKLKKIKGLLVTIKIVQPKHVDYINENIEWAQSKGFFNVRAVQLPSHKREYLLFMTKDELFQKNQTNPIE